MKKIKIIKRNHGKNKNIKMKNYDEKTTKEANERYYIDGFSYEDGKIYVSSSKELTLGLIFDI